MIQTSINSSVKDKIHDKNVLNSKFKNEELTSTQLLDHIRKGHTFCVAALKEGDDTYCHRKTDNFIAGQIVGIDIDNVAENKEKLSIEDGYFSYESAIADKELMSKAAFIYTTASHSEEHNRFRIVFVLKNRISDTDKFKQLINILTYKHSGDNATTSIVQCFYGASNCEHEFFRNTLDDAEVDELLAEAKDVFSKEYKSMENTIFDASFFTNEYLNEIIKHIFKYGRVDNSIWWKVPTILKSYCKLGDDEIIGMISKYVTETGDIRSKLKFADRYLGEMTLGTLIYHAKKNGYEMPAELYGSNKKIKFWKAEIIPQKHGNDKIDITISYNLFDRFLANNGFRNIEQERGNQLVRVDDKNQIDEISDSNIIGFVFDYLVKTNDLYESARERFAVSEQVRRQSTKLFSTTLKNLKSMNSELEHRLINDSKNHVNFFYQNGFRKIGADSDQFLNYEDLDGYIWKKTVLDRNFDQADDHKSEYQRFVECVCTRKDHSETEFDSEKYNSAISVIGYLISNYKKRTETIAVVLTDESNAETPEGGTGKSIFNEALGKVRRMTLIDGRNLNLDSPFHFSDVKISTEIINIDDCARNFHFERLYHSITGDVTVERKGKNRFTIPFDNAPKLCLSTNHIFKGNGNSHQRRIFELEFTDYFNADYTPEDEFGHQLFNDWDIVEWNRFDEFIAKCVQYYLKNGLIRSTQLNIDYKRLVENTSPEIAKYLNENIQPDKIYVMKELLNDFNRIHDNQILQHRLTKSLKYWASVYLKINFYDESNRSLNTKIFVVTDDKSKTLKYWKNSDQFSLLKDNKTY